MIPMIYLDFELRRDYISRNLCENRNKPLLNCNGKCYLSKKIAAAQEEEERQAECDFMGKLIEVAANLPLFEIIKAPVAPAGSIVLDSDFYYNNIFIGSLQPEGIFRPPIA